MAMPNMAARQTQWRAGPVPDPTKVVMIVDRDSNDIAFMDIASRKIVGRTFLGNNVNPYGDDVSGRDVTSSPAASAQHATHRCANAPTGEENSRWSVPEHLAFSPDGRFYYQGNPGKATPSPSSTCRP
jgi:hypothetical protein